MIAKKTPLVFPVHPRTKKNIEQFCLNDIFDNDTNILRLDPQNYIRFMDLIMRARFVLTDSGGIQEETSYLGVPCLTLRPNTERPITVEKGTNRLCSIRNLLDHVDAILLKEETTPVKIDLWDGKTAGRVCESIKAIFGQT
jgi:UDP-N-acetylglucosamine 2-epimerase (non-hydrolysing)